jgi:CDP-diacylglycerol--glycerol-3-phosphate 3-phosphatidyltransferase
MFFFDTPHTRILLFGVVIFTELTDFWDGYYARKRGEVTDLGKILDPIADSIYRDTIFLSLACSHQVSLFWILPIIYRDAIISTLRTVCAFRGIVVTPLPSSVVNSVVQGIAVALIVFLRVLEPHVASLSAQIFTFSNMLLAVAVLFALYSAYDYLTSLIPLIKQQSDDEENQ